LTIDATNFTGCTNARVYMPCDAYYTSSLTGKATLIKDHGRITGTAAYRAPTCTQKGVNGYSYCADCKTYFSGTQVYGKDYQSVTIPALGHALQFIDRAEPTETENGHIAYYSCSRCDECFLDADGATAITEDDYLLPATGHLPSEGVVVEAPTCRSEGRMKYTCPGCGEEYYEVIPVLGQSPEADPAVEATCTETGLTAGSHCSLCGAVLEEQQEVPALGHTQEDVPGKEASCTESGLTAGSRCSACGEVLEEQENIPAPGHHYENAFCRVCGAVLKGDVTLDGVITVKDVSLLYSMYVGRTEAIEELITIADMNGDERISLLDVSLLYVLSR
ncbi:MAG: dockerin type I repeat-containing protein, partial [Oscillospiraceae bacterium]|nr:dockerin type I repeat-containing protein [Oscillospiraceae bacterium]